MTTELNQATHSKTGAYKWRFFRSGGFDQIRIETGADIVALQNLDYKLWSALSCPTTGLSLDDKTLTMIDTDKDGHIRASEIQTAVKWACSVLKNPDDLTKGSSVLPLSAINDATSEGKKILSSAKQILTILGKSSTDGIAVEDTLDCEKIFSLTTFNGDGIITPEAAKDEITRSVINDIMELIGSEPDRSGQKGISKEKVDTFFSEVNAYVEWWQEAENKADLILPLGPKTGEAASLLKNITNKINDYFIRCSIAKFDNLAAFSLNPSEKDYLSIASQELSLGSPEINRFPIAKIDADQSLPLKEGINPVWINLIHRFAIEIIEPILGPKNRLNFEEWNSIQAKFEPYYIWLSQKKGAIVESIGQERIRLILSGTYHEKINCLIEQDKALESEMEVITEVERLTRYFRDLFKLINNFVSFSDFYNRKDKGIFQIGTLYIDGRSCELCVKVEDVAKHSAIAHLSQTYIAYCDCFRRGRNEKMTIAAAFTNGDSDHLMVGRNGIFYDRHGRDWDATIIKIIEHPISIRQAFWTPYKRIGRMIGEQMEKLASAREKAVQDKAAEGISTTTKKIETVVSTSVSSTSTATPFDVGKFAGIFAAIGLAIGAIGTAIASIITGFMRLKLWQMPLTILCLFLIISGPSVLLTWLKLRQKHLAPILDANGWAVNTRARINIVFGTTLTAMAELPKSSELSLFDPFADKKRPWKLYIKLGLLFICFAILGAILWKYWLCIS
ncbi:MAG: hypothetical protein HQK77_02075 [Desulfobacterales bacterium]|nr:hypothetical protein [Desulfobacterales bacterium]